MPMQSQSKRSSHERIHCSFTLVIVVFETTTVLLLRAHYTMDVFTGAVAARDATIFAARIAPWWDARLDAMCRKAG
jgi:hypothetical protein